ncbi:hypothetical protein BLJ79_12240 [Arthrobacter sp. UCD-GKA]|uniref:hypothetical protein n=1 Tax=Arthrobacter sp. UCD-GKA TaxID=1913576 RepID=UPI0008DD6380|nr:hypothetical protein [Arthrobacter sp. UCD-GKA]OIH84230.1 hypothetical protein BLJ79_12240 [Arthrobacter sp. UCD-GKA]
MLTLPIPGISIFDGARVATVTGPDGKRHVHGLGAVGDPILPFLDHRTDPAGGYVLTIAPAPDTPPVYRVNTHAEPLKSGRFPQERVPWSALGADDYSPFDGITVVEALTNGR